MTESKKTKNVLIFGATSLIAVHTARIWAERGWAFCLCARNKAELTRLADDLRVRGAQQVLEVHFDAEEPASIPSALNAAFEQYNHFDVLLLAHGYLPVNGEKMTCEEEQKTVRINLLSCMEIVCELRRSHLAGIKQGVIAGISSVAGDRGRAKNMVYCASKAGMTSWLSGLRQQLLRDRIHVLTILPGVIETPMTAHMPAGLLSSSPEVVARDIVRAVDRRKNVIYTPGYWRWIMSIIRHLPEFIFKHIKI